MKLLLDTCSFLWIGEGSSKLSETASRVFLDPENERYLSAASVWEICIKYNNGKLSLPAHPQFYVAQLRERVGVDPLSIDEESALQVAKLPNLHNDPFDRLLVAQSIVHGLTILTPDPLITNYPARTLW